MHTLETERLVIRPLVQSDAPFILRLYNTEGFLRFIGDKNIRTVEEASAYMRSGPITMYHKHGVGLCLVEITATRAPVGICGLIKRDYLRDIDLGYGFMPQYEGVGYAFEAATTVLDHAKNTLKRQSVAAIVTPENTRSIALLHRLGFHYEAPHVPPNTEKKLDLYRLSF